MPPRLDGRRKLKLEKGKIPVEAQLDLHGMTQNQAYDALVTFVENAYKTQKRCVLVITGLGRRTESGIGILKTRLPEWISMPPLDGYVLDYANAAQKHGGGGAFYLYLKRQK